ncbi:MAG: heme exporter protein CcmB [Flavobacteriales bacterium]|nr:heme exporter protein CcmB [Flavobacteriales bacterium]
MLLKEIKYLLWQELKLENRQRFAFNGILLYVISTVYVVYISTKGDTQPQTWVSLFWLIMLFASANALQKSFVRENSNRYLYLYTLSSPQGIIISKIIYNGMLTGVVSLLTWLVYSVLMGDAVSNKWLFLCSLWLGNTGIASLFTFISSISSKSSQNSTLVAVLGFPVLLPLLLTLLRLCNASVMGVSVADVQHYLYVLLALTVIIWAMAYLLFPYLWRE